VWRVFPKDPLASFKDLRAGTLVNRNRDMNWIRLLDKPSSERRIGVWLRLDETAAGFSLTLTDEDGHSATVEAAHAKETAKDAGKAEATLREHLGKLGTTPFAAMGIALVLSHSWFVPASFLNALRRDAVAALEAARSEAYRRPPRARPVEPPALYPEDTLSYLANVYNHKARDFYAKHGVQIIAAAYESHEETGEVSLMITKHCVRYSLSLCPKQAKGITGVQGTVRAAPLTLINGSEKLTLRFDCKACEMHVVGKLKPAVAKASAPLSFYKTRP
jgi:putative protease